MGLAQTLPGAHDPRDAAWVALGSGNFSYQLEPELRDALRLGRDGHLLAITASGSDSNSGDQTAVVAGAGTGGTQLDDLKVAPGHQNRTALGSFLWVPRPAKGRGFSKPLRLSRGKALGLAGLTTIRHSEHWVLPASHMVRSALG